MSRKELGRVTDEGVQFRSHLDGSSHFLSPELAVEIQAALGPDMMMTLDECVQYPASKETLQRAVKLTGRWARRAKEHLQKRRGSGFGVRGSAERESGSDHARSDDVASRIPNPESRTPALFGVVQGGTDKTLRQASAEEMLEIGFEGYALGGLSVGEAKSETYDVVEYTAA